MNRWWSVSFSGMELVNFLIWQQATYGLGQDNPVYSFKYCLSNLLTDSLSQTIDTYHSQITWKIEHKL
jgi:hypothetical protein